MKKITLITVAFVAATVFAVRPVGAQGSQGQSLQGHVPAVIARLRLPSVNRLPAATRLNLAIGLPLRHQEQLAKFLDQLYDAASPLYHKYLTPEQFTERYGPTEQDYQAVIAFAAAHGLTVTSRHPNRVVLDVSGTVSDIEQALHVTLRVYNHPKEARTFYAPDAEPSLDLAVRVLHISGLDNYALPHPMIRRAAPLPASGSSGSLAGKDGGIRAEATAKNGSGTGGSYMGDDFRAAYVPGTTLTGAGQSVGLVQFDGFYASDIAIYESQAGRTNVPLVVVPIDGGVSTPGDANGEVCLDIEMVISMAPAVSKIYLYEAPNPSPWVDVLNRMVSDNLSKQLSSSWGGGPPDPTSEGIFQQMAAQGQSFFNASGDADAFTGPIDFPADSPNITQVGGTTLTTSGPGGSWVSEKVWNWGYNPGTGGFSGSSGGISPYYSIPSWQQGISMVTNQGSTTLRNVPDVALTGDNVYIVADNGQEEQVGGTSCAAPLWAGFTALVNQQAAASGKPAVGFINPAIYAIGKSPSYNAAFHDITTGNNTWSDSPILFYAVPGYDLCAGWGTPSGANLINALISPIFGAGAALVSESCSPANGVIDPGETASVSFALQNLGGLDASNLVATLLATNGVILPSGPQTYDVLVAGGPAVSQTFTFTANGTCGGVITPTLQLKIGQTIVGTAGYALTLGQHVDTVLYSENFDGVSAPALPSGWTSVTSGAASNWVTTTIRSDTAPNSTHAAEPAFPGVAELISPSIAVPSATAQLTFKHAFTMEALYRSTVAYDGGALEIQIGNGPFTDILEAGGFFLAGGYSHIVELQDTDDPLYGRRVWSGDSHGFTNTIVALPASAVGQNIRLKWRMGTDTGNFISVSGWYIDTVTLIDPHYVCCAGLATVTGTITAIHPSGTNVVLNVNSATGATYTLEYKNSLTDTTWQPLPPSAAGTGGIISLQDTNPPPLTRFYRVRIN